MCHFYQNGRWPLSKKSDHHRPNHRPNHRPAQMFIAPIIPQSTHEGDASSSHRHVVIVLYGKTRAGPHQCHNGAIYRGNIDIFCHLMWRDAAHYCVIQMLKLRDWKHLNIVSKHLSRFTLRNNGGRRCGIASIANCILQITKSCWQFGRPGWWHDYSIMWGKLWRHFRFCLRYEFHRVAWVVLMAEVFNLSSSPSSFSFRTRANTQVPWTSAICTVPSVIFINNFIQLFYLPSYICVLTMLLVATCNQHSCPYLKRMLWSGFQYQK